jgi:hypothetical protein
VVEDTPIIKTYFHDVAEHEEIMKSIMSFQRAITLQQPRVSELTEVYDSYFFHCHIQVSKSLTVGFCWY